MSAEKFIEIQNQMRLNTTELKDYLADLDDWSTDVKARDEKLKQAGGESKSQSKDIPPVRNNLEKKVRKKKKSKKETKQKQPTAKERISGYDFQAWDKFDVDKACEDVEEDKQKESSSEYETDEEWEELRRKQQAILMKDQGNQYFKEGKYEEAIECYTRGINSDSSYALLPANRAMALLKQEKFAAAELDCTVAISLDPTYLKAYQRRGASRVALNKLKEAKDDFHFVLSKEPNNKLAKAELEKIEKLMNPPQFSTSTEGDVGIVKPINKPQHLRSKKPLRRLTIEEVGEETEEEKSRKLAEHFTKRRSVPENKSSTDTCVAGSLPILSPADINIPQYENTAGKGGENLPPETVNLPDLKLRLDGETSTGVPTVSNTERSAKHPRQNVSARPTARVPTTSYHFQADWKELKNDPEAFFEYFKEISPPSFPKLIGQFLDADVLVQILAVLKDMYIPKSLDIFPVLQNLALVKRFEMNVMFMSTQDKTVVKALFDHLRLHTTDTAEIDQLAKKYDL